MTRDDTARERYDPDDDALEREYDRLWYEIRRLLPKQERLSQRRTRTTREELELEILYRRIMNLRRRTRRFREVIRMENMAKAARPRAPMGQDKGPDGTPVLYPRWPWDE